MLAKVPLKAHPLGSAGNPLRVAVVGSGPSGFYAAQALLESAHHVEVDMLERLPTPFGLVRYGVAPDHVKLKSTSSVFTGIASDPQFCFWGNVTVGREIAVDVLRSLFHAVIIATGSSGDRKLSIAGEHLDGVYAASDFVGWYNGSPDCANLSFDLQQETAVVIGMGNVAIDVCRILMKPIDQLRKTDMPRQALDVLAASHIRDIHLIGRRGPAQASFTPRAFRELAAIPNVQVIVDANDLALNPSCESELRMAGTEAARARKNLALLRSVSSPHPQFGMKSLYLHFCQAPTAFSGSNRLRHIHLESQHLCGAPGAQRAQATGVTQTMEAGAVFRSVGYQGNALEGLPFDSTRGVIPNEQGRVSGCSASDDTTGLYVAGWIKRGPTGVIGSNRADSLETVEQVFTDLVRLNSPKPGRTTLYRRFAERAHRVVSFDDWLSIERTERERGRAAGKAAEKIVDVDEMLKIVSRNSSAITTTVL